MNVFKMAWRNVWRNYRRSAITITAMTIALVIEILYSGLITGMMLGMEENAISLDTGDIQITTPAYVTKPSLYEVVEDHETVIADLEAKGYRASERLFAGGLAASGESSAGVGFVGLDPVKDAEVLDLNEYVGQGEWLADDDPLGVVIGTRLARNLGAEIGSEIVVLSQGADGSVANELFTVRGIMKTVAATIDRSTILMTETTFRELMVLPEGAHKIIVRRELGSDLALANDEVRAMLDLPPAAEQAAKEREARLYALNNPDAEPLELPAYPVAVQTWKELNPSVAQYLESVQGMIVIMFLIIYLAVAILILNAMLMAVFERIREFGVLKAIGYGPIKVLSLMVLEGFLQAVVACVIGAIIAAPCMWYLATYGINVGALGGMEMSGLTMPAVWKCHYTVETTAPPVFLLFFIVFGAVIYPALKAAWINPVKAMQHQ